jgi:hypothetical protein
MIFTDRELELLEQALTTEIDKIKNMHKAKDRLCLFSLEKVYGKIYTTILRRKDGRKIN